MDTPRCHRAAAAGLAAAAVLGLPAAACSADSGDPVDPGPSIAADPGGGASSSEASADLELRLAPSELRGQSWVGTSAAAPAGAPAGAAS